jgi:hypothetical protein
MITMEQREAISRTYAMGTFSDFFESIAAQHDVDQRQNYPIVVFAYPGRRQEEVARSDLLL